MNVPTEHDTLEIVSTEDLESELNLVRGHWSIQARREGHNQTLSRDVQLLLDGSSRAAERECRVPRVEGSL